MKYIILANSSNGFDIPKQLSVINGEKLICRTIRLLKENGIKNIIISSKDKRFDNLGAKRHTPLLNNYDEKQEKSHWVKAFPIELMTEPVVFLFGDVYYSENAIKTIIEKDNHNILFFFNPGQNEKYIKKWEEPLAWKIYNIDKFIYHIYKLIDMWNNNQTWRRPINWEIYRSINGLDVNVHKLKDNYILINDESCDVDELDDIKKIEMIIGEKNDKITSIRRL